MMKFFCAIIRDLHRHSITTAESKLEIQSSILTEKDPNISQPRPQAKHGKAARPRTQAKVLMK